MIGVASPDPRQLKSLEGPCAGLYELRFTIRNVQWRPLAYYGPGPRDMRNLFIARDVNNRWVPPSACQIARGRSCIVQEEAGRSVEHVWG